MMNDIVYLPAHQTLLNEEQRLSSIKPYKNSLIKSHSSQIIQNPGSGQFLICAVYEIIHVDGNTVEARAYYQNQIKFLNLMAKVDFPSQASYEIACSQYSDKEYLVIWECLEVEYDGKVDGTRY